jgi:hypothetical protein
MIPLLTSRLIELSKLNRIGIKFTNVVILEVNMLFCLRIVCITYMLAILIVKSRIIRSNIKLLLS